MPHEVVPDTAARMPTPLPLAHPSAFGRIITGTVLAMGLYLAVRKTLTGAVLALVPDPGAWWLSFNGLLAVYCAQAVAVGFGAVVAAAGRQYGYSLGFIVGGVCGGLFLGFELLAGAPPEVLVLYLQPPLLALLGLMAGVAGSRIWVPPPVLNLPVSTGSQLSSLQLGADMAEEQPRPTMWVHILAGACIMVVGVVGADKARQGIQSNSGGILKVESLAQGEFITWQMATFAVLAGGVAAGAGTGSGIRHGILAGFLGAAGVLGVCTKIGQGVPPIEYWLSKMQLDGLPLTAPPVIAAVGGGVLFISLLGGWLGGALFLPLAPAHMRRRLQVGLD